MAFFWCFCVELCRSDGPGCQWMCYHGKRIRIQSQGKPFVLVWLTSSTIHQFILLNSCPVIHETVASGWLEHFSCNVTWFFNLLPCNATWTFNLAMWPDCLTFNLAMPPGSLTFNLVLWPFSLTFNLAMWPDSFPLTLQCDLIL